MPKTASFLPLLLQNGVKWFIKISILYISTVSSHLQKLYWPFTVRKDFSIDLDFFDSLPPSHEFTKFFSNSETNFSQISSEQFSKLNTILWLFSLIFTPSLFECYRYNKYLMKTHENAPSESIVTHCVMLLLKICVLRHPKKIPCFAGKIPYYCEVICISVYSKTF